jgi:HK97 family phage portal protein
MGVFDIFKKNSELEFLFDFDFIEDTTKKFHVKKIALETCVGLIARTIAQSEFRVKNGTNLIKDELFYRLNVRPSQNESAAQFWERLIYRLILDNEVLVIKSDTDDLLIADSFTRTEYAIFEDAFKDVTVKGYKFDRTFQNSKVIYLTYSNERLKSLIESLYTDFEALFSRVLEFQKRKNQIRGLVDIDAIHDKTEEGQKKLQAYIDKIYKSFAERSIAVIPQSKGFNYHEMNPGATPGVDEINKVTDGFLYQVARVLGIPIALIKGDQADIENPTRNFMRFCIDSFLKKIGDELNAKLFTRDEYLDGRKIEIKRISYNNIFDVASAVDKLRASGVFNGNELREELGAERIDDEMMNQYFITKNYQELGDALKGGDITT